MRKTYYNNTSFLDILFNFLLISIILLAIAVSFIIVERNKADIETKAEFVLILKWTGEHDNDIDIWINDPADRTLWFREKEVGMMHLDRDDRGHIDDRYTASGGKEKIIFINQEIATIRGILAGEWTVNIHLYRQNINEPTDTNIKLIKLNPRATVIFDKDYKMSTYWEEITVARFTMTQAGEILDIDDTYKDLIRDQVRASATVYDGPPRRPE